MNNFFWWNKIFKSAFTFIFYVCYNEEWKMSDPNPPARARGDKSRRGKGKVKPRKMSKIRANMYAGHKCG